MHSVVVVGLVILFAVPDHRLLVGTFLESEGFHHWDYYAIAPTNAYLTGLRPVIDFYSQYGIGIPVFLGSFFKLTGLFSYANTVWLGMAFGAIYYIALYLLLCLLIRNWYLRLVGLILALMLQQFSGLAPGTVLWQTPSSTVLRTPVDMFLFILLLLHLRSNRWQYLALAGLLTGLAVFWETDTGLYLYAGYLAYFGYRFVNQMVTSQMRSWRMLWGYLATVAIVPMVFIWLVYLSIGKDVFAPVFWERLLVPINLFSAGFGMLPMPSPTPSNLYLFLTPSLYVFSAVFALVMAISRGGGHWKDAYVLGSIGVYGLALYHQYIGRSHPYNWYHISIPVVVILVVLIYQLLKEPRFIALSANIVLLLMTFVVAINAIFPIITYFSAGAPVHRPSEVIEWSVPRAGFRTISIGSEERDAILSSVDLIEELVPPDQPVAILSETDVLYYVLAGRRPFTQYAPLYPQVVFRQQIDDVAAALSVPNLEYVFIEPCPSKWHLYPASPLLCEDLPEVLFPVVTQNFKHIGSIGYLEIWQRNR
jgi:hypothetical protein